MTEPEIEGVLDGLKFKLGLFDSGMSFLEVRRKDGGTVIGRIETVIRWIGTGLVGFPRYVWKKAARREEREAVEAVIDAENEREIARYREYMRRKVE